MKKFLSCYWGTSSFRLRLVETDTFKFSSVEDQEQGILKWFELWKKSGKEEQERFFFYRAIIDEYIKKLEQQLNISLQHIPLIISGMACSSIGMMNLPYKEIPFHANGSDAGVKKIPAAGDFNHDIIIISGAKKDDDVMRGEETQLAGCTHDTLNQHIFIFPGTHSKHVTVSNGMVADIRTYMTGEFFELLSKKSILATGVEEGEGLINLNNKESFELGVSNSLQSNLLHACFLIRTNELFGELNKAKNYYYLSGLLIGTELRELI